MSSLRDTRAEVIDAMAGLMAEMQMAPLRMAIRCMADVLEARAQMMKSRYEAAACQQMADYQRAMIAVGEVK